MSAVLQDEEGQILEAHSVSAGLDYPGVGPEHAFLRDSGRVRYVAVQRRRGARGVPAVSELEGILPALEPAHALAWLMANPSEGVHLVTLSGRGDKDLAEVLALSEGAGRNDAAAKESPGRERRRDGHRPHRGRIRLARQARRVDAVPDGRPSRVSTRPSTRGSQPWRPEPT